MQRDTSTCVKYFHFTSLLQAGKWMKSAYVGVNEQGIIQTILTGEPHEEDIPVEPVRGVALPGFQNAHSHAFQFAMAGMAETHAPGTNDDFWSWREAMYRCALSMDADQLQNVATALYIEMLKKGYTHVAEFHYLHHDKNGQPYDNEAEISVSLLAAAARAGIRITLVPVFYQKGGFNREAQPLQRRFIFKSVDEYMRLVEEASEVAKNLSTARIGYGVHSLRAASAEDVVRISELAPKHLPFHLHAAEQLQEVNDCLASLQQRPVEWLLDHLPLSDRFNIVHCTHLNEEELMRLASTKANVVLCPGTEGNLGDGIFQLTQFTKHRGNWCIGTDSHISLNPLEDLRWLDYVQRLVTHQRNTFDDGGFQMISKSFFCGSKAMGIDRKDLFEVGKPLDAVVFRTDSFLTGDHSTDHLLSRVLYTADSSVVLGTIVNGNWIVQNGYHKEEENILPLFQETLRTISQGN